MAENDDSTTKEERRALAQAREAQARDKRMKASLRANLQRRKQKARALKDQETDASN